jgi:hypothetical protein
LQDNTISLNARTVVTANECGAIITNFIPFPQAWGEKVTSQKEERMYDHDIDFDTIDSGAVKSHLHDRAVQAFEEHAEKLRVHFHLNDDAAPATYAEFVKRIQDNKFVLADNILKVADKPGSYNNYQAPAYFLQWRDPEVEADQAGYNEARNKLDDAFDTVTDEIIVYEPVSGLTALNNFRKATFH